MYLEGFKKPVCVLNVGSMFLKALHLSIHRSWKPKASEISPFSNLGHILSSEKELTWSARLPGLCYRRAENSIVAIGTMTSLLWSQRGAATRWVCCLGDITAFVALAGIALMSHISGLLGNEADFFQESRGRKARSGRKEVEWCGEILTRQWIKAAWLFLFFKSF